MPWKPKRPCPYSGCPNLPDGKYCEAHKKKAVSEEARAYNENSRDREAQRFYDSSAWRKLRAIKKKRSPLCEECYRQGRITPAYIVDHIIERRERPDIALDIDNLQTLCMACHNRKHGWKGSRPSVF
jgi:5-methylcytosine-specific restriction protein A